MTVGDSGHVWWPPVPRIGGVQLRLDNTPDVGASRNLERAHSGLVLERRSPGTPW